MQGGGTVSFGVRGSSVYAALVLAGGPAGQSLCGIAHCTNTCSAAAMAVSPVLLAHGTVFGWGFCLAIWSLRLGCMLVQCMLVQCQGSIPRFGSVVCLCSCLKLASGVYAGSSPSPRSGAICLSAWCLACCHVEEQTIRPYETAARNVNCGMGPGLWHGVGLEGFGGCFCCHWYVVRFYLGLCGRPLPALLPF